MYKMETTGSARTAAAAFAAPRSADIHAVCSGVGDDDDDDDDDDEDYDDDGGGGDGNNIDSAAAAATNAHHNNASNNKPLTSPTSTFFQPAPSIPPKPSSSPRQNAPCDDYEMTHDS